MDREFICLLVGSDQGRTGYRDELTARVEARGLASRVFIRDDCTDMPACYMLADVVVSASTDPEAFGRIAAEAQAMGRPLVASAHGGVPEQVIDGETAFLVAPSDDAALADGIARALDLGADARASMATAARAQARQFSKQRMCADTLAVYEELLGWRAAPGRDDRETVRATG
jgi:glycosyltransferase involved in cell wall biosynthesis